MRHGRRLVSAESSQVEGAGANLVPFALQCLRRMQLPTGLFCADVARGAPEPRGESLRYTAMVLLGLLKADAAGYAHGFELGEIRAALLERLAHPALRPGDFGLLLWADALTGGERAGDLEERLGAALAAGGGLPAREGMEVAWIAQGLALSSAGRSGRGEALLREALELLLGRNRAASGLFYHFGRRPGRAGLRRRFPNFATQSYGVLALATIAKLDLHDAALGAARRAADVLLALQLPDGGWPWLYDADRGRVVERYEVYSVHQHAMAPMALLQLAEAGGGERYVEAALAGLRWIDGRNELGIVMVAPEERMIYRSIRRRRPWDRVLLAANTLSGWALGVPAVREGRRVELNPVCCSYELGWLCEAWAGRERLFAPGAAKVA
jgi:hypothetical protein